MDGPTDGPSRSRGAVPNARERPRARPRSEPSAVASSSARRARWPAVLLLLPVAELVAQLDVSASVPPRADWRAAAAFVQAHTRTADAQAMVVTEPAWAEPIARWSLGRVPASQIGAFDLAGRRTALVMSIRGHWSSAFATRPPRELRRFGGVSVLRYELHEPRSVFDFVQALDAARVTWGSAAHGWGECRQRRVAMRGGGLAFGTMFPDERFVCDGSRPWLAVGATIQQDLGLTLRRCVAQTAPRGHVVSTRFSDVSLAGVLEGRIGLAHGDERLRREDVLLTVRIGADEVARVRHRDGDGAKPFSVDLRRWRQRAVGEVAFETTLGRHTSSSDSSEWRAACWSAGIRSRRGATPIEVR